MLKVHLPRTHMRTIPPRTVGKRTTYPEPIVEEFLVVDLNRRTTYPEPIVEESLVVELEVEDLVVWSDGLVDTITIAVGSRKVELQVISD